MLEYMKRPKIGVSDIWNDVKNAKKYTDILSRDNVLCTYVNCENKYDKVYCDKNHENATCAKEYEEFGLYVYKKERKYLIDHLIEKHHRCPICGNPLKENNIECDHILNKLEFKEYIFTPINIAIICHGCNHSKGSKNDEGIFNPYIDKVDDSVKNKIKFIFNFERSISIDIKYPKKLEIIFKTYNLKQTIIEDAKTRLDIINSDIRNMCECRTVNKNSLRKAILQRKYTDILLKKYKAEYYNDQFINDLVKNLDSYVKFLNCKYNTDIKE